METSSSYGELIKGVGVSFKGAKNKKKPKKVEKKSNSHKSKYIQTYG